MSENNSMQLFENQPIRSAWDAEKEEWYFSIVDVVAALTDSRDPAAYWRKLKQRLKEEGNETVTNCHGLKMTAADGKKRMTDVADTEQLLRIIQSIPSPKAEPFKLWLAQVGRERIEETIDPEQAIDRALETYLKKGYSEEWVHQRLLAIRIRNELTDEWQMQNINSGAFSSVNPGVSNTITGYFGVAGLSVRCIANYDAARAEFVISLSDLGENQAIFDRLLAHRQEIESAVGTVLDWERAGDSKASVIGCTMDGVSVTNESDWPAVAKFHAERSERLCSVLLPYLVDESSREARLMRIAGALRRWAVNRPEIKLNLAKSSRSCTRFTTETMSTLLPDAPEALSGWNTPNHYFYEIVNRDGENVRIQLSFSAHNIPDTLRAQCERIDALTHSDPIPDGWQWRVTFKTSSVPVADPIDETALFAGLDKCLEEVRKFEGKVFAKLSRANEQSV